jgi:D-alanyl-lipoteichoic acid acyltransferase DltB (MBOAT superfamily)
MLFSSIVFLFVFLPCVLVVYYKVLKQRSSRNHFLLLVSLFFYAWGEPIYVFLMLGSIMGNFLFGILIERYRGQKIKVKMSLTGMLIFNLGLLIGFKYLNFIADNVNKIGSLQLDIGVVTLPLGVSFFTFQGISYGLDIYRNKRELLKNPLDVGLYIAFFPQLIAGPIVRYETIAGEIYSRQESLEDFTEGIERFIKGLAKKVLLANNFALIADKAFGQQADVIPVGLAWMGAVGYMLQIYFDFSGYSDMAIGLGRMFGFHFNENFNAPYRAKTISEFWRRWHISLGTWFRDYLYFPLGGSRVKNKIRLIVNLFIVWLLTGLWHGANWTFVVWGIYFFFWITIEKLCQVEKYFKSSKVIGHAYVIGVVLFGWILFRAQSLTYALTYMQSMFGLNENRLIGSLGSLYFHENKILFIIGIICCLPLKQWLHRGGGIKTTYTPWHRPIILILFFITAVAYLVKGNYNPFIYFNF